MKPTSVWLALFLYCLIPSSIMALSDVLLIREKMDLKKFASRIFQSFSSNFGGNFLSRGVQKNYQMTISFYFFNGIIIWIAYRASITAGLSQKIVELPFKVKFFQYFVFLIFCTSKGQIISECPYEIIVYPKIATKKFPRFLPWPLRRGQIKKIKALYYTN